MVDLHRRNLLRGARPQEPRIVPRPPWALQPDAAFVQRCTRCNDCVRACGPGVLRAREGGYPEIDFAQAGCTLCGDCSRACTTGAIGAPVGAGFAWRVRVGDACLARHGVECRLCGDACDTRALRFLPARGGVAQLRVDEAACTGCGACVAPCPVRAIDLRRT